MAKPLKDRPITQGVIGNAVFYFIQGGVSGVIAFIVAHSAYLKGIELHWAILLGIAGFALLAFALNTIRRFAVSLRSVPESPAPAHSNGFTHVGDEKNDIGFYVKVWNCDISGRDFNPPNASIQFSFMMWNCSIYPVSFDRNIGGLIRYGSRPLKGEKILSGRYRVTNIKRGWGTRFIVEQQLSEEDVDFINNNNKPHDPPYFFNFEDLIINIIGPDFSPQPLRLSNFKGIDLSGKLH